ncbi:BapA/Bap/LapF family prefix-like domain-containing protein [Agrobacterium tumefaciens]|uniref:BapA/Bap/LapF family prefix-like domain-containing protein n=1 Tax=Agrobacterium tumefaciens TaxID=358 RepID=UPI0009C76414|nr:BapA prefix-like domain-containing protein [Agrobacterium tumefaciens]CUX05321.1 hypothetical protein AGR1C_pAt20247 [Agrobacterium fabacearum TT111]
MVAIVTDKAAGGSQTVSLDKLDIEKPSIVRIRADKNEVSDFVRDGDDLLLRMRSGETIRIGHFFREMDGEHSELVLEDENGNLWLGEHSDGLADFRFSQIEGVDQLVGAATSDGSVLGLVALGLLAGGEPSLLEDRPAMTVMLTLTRMRMRMLTQMPTRMLTPTRMRMPTLTPMRCGCRCGRGC